MKGSKDDLHSSGEPDMTHLHISAKAGALLATVACALATPVIAQTKSATAASTSASAAKGSSGSASAPASGTQEVTVLAPLMLLVPTKVSVDDATKNGCWVRLYDRKNFQGDSFTLSGPIDLAQMKGPFGFSWENKVHSLETGPKTSLTIYDNRNFRDHDKTIPAGTKVADMSKKMGFFDDFRSMKMSCGS
jgi:hypothetical protein